MKRHPLYDQIKTRLEQGQPVIAISNELHLCQRTVRKVRDENGIPVFQGSRPPTTCRNGHTYPQDCPRHNDTGHRHCPTCERDRADAAKAARRQLDEVAVAFAAGGRAPSRLRHNERVEVLKRLQALPDQLDTDEVARRLACSERTVWRLRKTLREQTAVAA